VKSKTNRSQSHQNKVAAGFRQLFLHRIVAGTIEREEIEVRRKLVVDEQNDLAKERDFDHVLGEANVTALRSGRCA